MRRLVFWLIFVPALAGIVVFALNNRSVVAVDLWPFGVSVEMPIYLAFLLSLGGGVVLGGFVSWLGQSRTRAQLREQVYQGEVARRELAAEREKTARLERASQTPAKVERGPPSKGAVQDVVQVPVKPALSEMLNMDRRGT